MALHGRERLKYDDDAADPDAGTTRQAAYNTTQFHVALDTPCHVAQHGVQYATVAART
jgi:hypothetical protein